MKDILILDSEFYQRIPLIKAGKSEMTNEYMYDFVAYLGEFFFGLTVEKECEREQYWLDASSPEWINVVVQNLVDFKLPVDNEKVTSYQLLKLENSWRATADDEVLSRLILYHGTQHIGLMSPLLESKEGRSDYFRTISWLIPDVVGDEGINYDVVSEIAHFVNEVETWDESELVEYAQALLVLDAKRVIPILEKLRERVPDFPVKYFVPFRTYHQLLEDYIQDLKQREN